MPFVPDTPRKSRFVPDAPKRSGPDPFAGDDLLSDEAVAKLEAGERSTVTPTDKPGAARYAREYVEGLQQAGAELAQPSDDLPGVGTAEMLGALATGLVSPLTGAIRSAATGEPYRQARDAQVYQPRTQSGRAMVGGLGALVKPATDVFALAGRTAGKVLEPLPGVSEQDAQELGAATVDALGLASTARGATMKTPARAPKQKPAEVPSTQELEVAKNAAYKEAHAAGVTLRPDSFDRFVTGAAHELTGKHLNPKLHPGASEALKELVSTSQRRNPLTLEEIDQLRQIVRDAPTSKADARMTRIIVERMDAYLDGLTGKDLTAGDAQTAVAALRRARELNRRKENAALLDSIERKAGYAGKGKFTQAGDEHALRDAFRKLANSDKQMKKFTPAEREAIEQVIMGEGRFHNWMRDLGKMDPTKGGLPGWAAMTSSAVGALSGGPEGLALGLVVPAAGIVGRRLATRATRRNVGRAREELVGRGLPTQPTGAKPGSARAQGVAAALGLPPQQKPSHGP